MSSDGGTAPLKGKRILVTRSLAQAPELSRRLEALGASVQALPLTSILPPWQWNEVDGAIARIDQFDWIVFASVNAVSFFLKRCAERQQLKNVTASIAAIGPATVEKLKEFGLRASFVPSSYTAEKFASQFKERNPDLAGKRILWPRGNLGRLLIAEELKAVGAAVECVECYRNLQPEAQPELAATLTQLLKRRDLDAILFTSGQAVKNFASLVMDRSRQSGPESSAQAPVAMVELEDVCIVSIGPETSKTCRAMLGKLSAEASTHTIDGLLETVIELMSGKVSQ
jgi:uroporphyrinogen-III synthase